MSNRKAAPLRFPLTVPVWLLAGLLVATLVSVAWGGLTAFRNGAVGGVSINADGILGPPAETDRSMLLQELRRRIKEPGGALGTRVPLRMVSLRALEAACDQALKGDFGELPDEVRFLAGLQRIQYVFVFPEKNDIVLAGPGEGWKVDERANIVGATTGRPVLRLDDLLVALRYVHDARVKGISCSIDFTQEGYRRVREVMKEQYGRPINPAALEAAIKRASGPHTITITGVPLTSHFARVLSAADYRMKRIGMNLEPSPVRGLTSYVDLIKFTGSRGLNTVNPRWWLACNYQPLATSEDRLAWELRGPGVKALTENDLVTAEGAKPTGKASPAAQKWADMMTEHYEELCAKEPVFGDLRNLMDMCVVAALLEKEGLWDMAGLAVPLLRGANSPLKIEIWNAPKTVAPEVSILQVRPRGDTIVTASGGVQVESWQVASRTEVSPHVQQVRQKAVPPSESLWWQ